MHDAGQGQGVGGQRARVDGVGEDAAQFWGVGLGERVGQRDREVQQSTQDVVVRLAGGAAYATGSAATGTATAMPTSIADQTRDWA
jgi:hypothetical protein